MELPFGLPSDKQQHLGGVDSPKSGAAEPQLSALNLRRHNQQMAAERELGEVCGRARRQLSLGVFSRILRAPIVLSPIAVSCGL